MLIKDYYINRGGNYSYSNGIPQMIPKPFVGNDLGYFAKLDKGAIYTLPDDGGDDDNFDWNKLPGFSGCSVFHHTSSARAGWRPDQNSIFNDDIENRIQLSAYVYDKGDLYRDWDSDPYKDQVLMLNEQLEPLYVGIEEWFGVRIIDYSDHWIVGFGIVNPAKAKLEEPPGVKDIIERRVSRLPKSGCEGGPVRSRLNPYFGGDRKSVNKINMTIAYVKGWESFES